MTQAIREEMRSLAQAFGAHPMKSSKSSRCSSHHLFNCDLCQGPSTRPKGKAKVIGHSTGFQNLQNFNQFRGLDRDEEESSQSEEASSSEEQESEDPMSEGEGGEDVMGGGSDQRETIV